MRAWIILLLLAAAASADAYKTWRGEMRRLGRLDKDFWKDYQKRWVDAEAAYWLPWREARSKKSEHPNPNFDYTEFYKLYEDYAKLQDAMGRADAALAASGHDKAAATLLDELLDVAKRIDKLEKSILDGRPVQHDMFDQEPAVEYFGLLRRERALVEALAKCPGAAAFLAGEGLKQAKRKDGRRSATRRVAVIDALGLTGAPAARSAIEPLLKSPESTLRIAALEALLRFGPDARPVLVPLLGDPNPVVRRALLEGIRTRAANDGLWIPAVLTVYGKATGIVRADCVRTLHALTRQTFGDASAKWDEWYAVYQKEIEGGRFDKEQIEVQEAQAAPAPGGFAFYGIRTPSRGVVFVVDGSRRAWWPAAWEVQKTQYKYHWDRTHRTWNDEHPSHQRILLKEFDRASRAFPEDLRFGLVALHTTFQADPLKKRPVEPTRGNLRAARRMLEKLPADGWCAQLEGIYAAARIGGLGPESHLDFPEAAVDTIFLVNGGDPAGGRFVNPHAVLAAFERFNRFRRLRVHAIRICNDGDASEILMKGLAEASRGTYLWAAKPPEENS